MLYTLGLKQLPFEQDPRQIIYVENGFDGYINKYIKCYYKQIRKCFEEAGYEFIYIPWYAKETEASDDYKYIAPYRRNRETVRMNSDFILDYMTHPENRNKILPSLLYYDPTRNNVEEGCEFCAITVDHDAFKKSEDLSSLLKEIIADIEDHRVPLIRFQKVSRVEYDIRDEENIRFSVREKDFAYDADSNFDSESKELIEEIKERIEKLNKKGIRNYIIKQLLKEEDDNLSRLRITKDYRIFLPDYKNMEIKMTPLPKAVFLLFLNHPEGIMFKYLPDYKDELMQIYKKVKGPLFESTSALRSIEDVTNPLSNSINEKCARIREAFISQFDEHLAQFYFVDGRRGEEKKILLPRELVEWFSPS